MTTPRAELQQVVAALLVAEKAARALVAHDAAADEREGLPACAEAQYLADALAALDDVRVK